MITIDRIRAEIKKLQDIFVETAQGMETEDEATVYSMCAVEFGDELLSFLDTLEEPVSDCHDLGEEVKRYYSENFSYITSDNPTLSILTNIARHFAKWGAEHLRDSTKMTSDDLEEAAGQYLDNHKPLTRYNWGDLMDAFKTGAEWQARQLLKSSPLPEDTVIFQKGVEEGKRLEREDALAIADIEKLHTFLYAVKNNKHGAFTFTRLSDEQYEEVLRRFNKTKEQ